MPGRATRPEVVAAEVDEHHVLGAFLGVALELVGDTLVVGVVHPSWPRTGDGMGRHPVAIDLEEQLWAGADDLEVGRAHEEEVGAWVDASERAIETDAIETAALSAAR